jgi:hypothetical protein
MTSKLLNDLGPKGKYGQDWETTLGKIPHGEEKGAQLLRECMSRILSRYLSRILNH